MLPNVVITDFTGLNLKYFAYFTTDKDTRLNLFSQNSRCRGRFIANEACTRREQTFRFSAAVHYLISQQILKVPISGFSSVLSHSQYTCGHTRSRVEILANSFR
jgi:hypothetical protein